MSVNQDITLANIASDSFQEAIIGHCIKDSKFFLKCIELENGKEKIKPEWITASVPLRNIYCQMIEFHKANHRAPQSIAEVLNQSFFIGLTHNEQIEYAEICKRCVYTRSGEEFGLDIVKKKLTGFIRTMKMREMVQTTYTYLTKSGADKAYQWSKKVIQELDSLTFEDKDNRVDFSGAVTWLFDSLEKDKNVISTGSKHLDAALNGGLFRGEASAIMAASNTGKTNCLITIIRHCLVNKYKVLFITHEGNKDRIKRQILSAITGFNMREFSAYINKIGVDPTDSSNRLSPDKVAEMHNLVIQEIEAAEKLIEENLVFIHHVKVGKMFIEDVTEIIKDRQKIAIDTWGKGFDLIVDDYPKKLRAKNSSKNEIRRVELADIYDTFNNLAADLNSHCLVALQTNRAAAKANKGTVERDTFIDTEDADESYGIIQNLASVVTLNRSNDDIHNNIIHLSVSKARGGPVNHTVTFRTRYDRSLLFGDYEMFDRYGKIINSLTKKGGFASFYRERNIKMDSSKAAFEISGIENGTEIL